MSLSTAKQTTASLAHAVSRFVNAAQSLLRRCAGLRDNALLAKLLNRLDEALDGLTSTSDAVERRFVSIGSLFHEQVLINDQLVRQSDELSKLVGEDNDGKNLLQRSQELAENALQFVDESATRSLSLVAHLDTYDQQIQTVQQGEAQFTRTLIPLQIIERLFRIESASLPSDMQSAFISLTQEIATLHGQMRKTLSKQFHSLSANREQISVAKTQLRLHATSLAQRVAQTRAGVASRMEDLDRRIISTHEKDTRLGSISRELARETSDVMVALQYQDTMRQKADHVHEALVDLRGQLLNSRSLSPKQVSEVAMLETRQLDNIKLGLEEASNDIANGIQQMGARLDDIDRDCLALDDIEQTVVSAQSVSDILLHTIAEARSLVAEALSGTEKTYAAIQTFGNAATNVTSTLRQLAFDIRLIALNAQIQAAQVGAGTGLEVLSERTCDLSEETGQFTRQIGVELEELIRLLTGVDAECQKLRSESQDHLDRINSKSETQEDELVVYRSRIADVLEGASELIHRSRQNASALLNKTDFSRLSRQPLVALQTVLHDIQSAALQLAPRRARVSPEDGAKSLDRLNARYTMDSERMVYAETFGVPTENRIQRATKNYRIEYFDDPNAKAHEPRPLNQSTSQDGSYNNVELF